MQIYTNLFFIWYLILLLWRSVAIRNIVRDELKSIVHDNVETVIYFYAKWCKACESFDPIFESVAAEYAVPDRLNFVKFDAGSDRAFAAPLVEDSYPGVALMRGTEIIDHMRALKTRENLELWLEQMTGDPVKILSSHDEVEKEAAKFPVTFVVEVPSQLSRGFKDTYSLAKEHRDWAKWLVIFNKTKASNVVSIKHPFETVKSTGFSSAEELAEWTSFARFPLFGPLDASNQHLYYETGRNPVMLVGTAQDFLDYGLTFRKVAVKRKDKFVMVWFNSNQDGAQATLTNMMVREAPALVVFTGTGNKREHKRFVYPGDKTDLHDAMKVTRFLDDVLAKKIRPRVKSLPQPMEDELSVRRVKLVTGDTFEEQVLNDKKDFMLVLTSPKGNDIFKGCLGCEPLLKLLERLSEEIEADIGPQIDFGEFLVTANELPLFDWGGTWEFEELPVIYLVKAGKKKPIEYKGKMNATSILQFWENNTENRTVRERKLSKVLSFIFEDETVQFSDTSKQRQPGKLLDQLEQDEL